MLIKVIIAVILISICAYISVGYCLTRKRERHKKNSSQLPKAIEAVREYQNNDLVKKVEAYVDDFLND